ncbi:hypothetical protein A3G67_00065 [Candidatus Roizmanbacteria bacterium RIFCSPLOWO2_12_FULL_40_12]|uniref:DUF5667 domain-containing protein n=1 Tax=Candidatus Roizmanbacteria bacterium RIFCSPLOWO2_01_FULL_40_42 TaxID=1802066 RepID=A0A1F7J4B3_9BACT|nr:MAG: hypothetical protein A2779_02230 [Candidatus Roizmanbacteria bacterium RIFCSPHIGHO2_01_FULL_40_98]OGK28602.1 MAG: hypothetical protein A3C31_03145 [Candidatus Roizmanbacteria bacterium RIFCSPHIGHO2_02_FULL_40_53]OGK29888.1 MAG: hypothetical protein A2W49_04345 [Candidatus Roizmanbacteria bacterium RIFCSPHIGHO2_12_41_18]OGK36747.1 MAG: hypothetical protein A3E69_03350 [Candidatus Roizmanbacteria bacterium RIFCSPHIGHO2_12_FULL_40_130]OGK50453.1 MAG: hypothetical protein A3B50_04075 [Candi
MVKKIGVPIILGIFLLFIVPVFYLVDYSQQVSLNQDKVEYQLPHPGILPDHPLYVFKAARDKVLEFFTRENIKKAELYLLFSDKRVKMAEELASKGKSNLAITTFSKAEKYFLKIPDLLRDSKKQGVGPSAELIDHLKKSNEKHAEVLSVLLETLPEGEQEGLSQIRELNLQVSNELSTLK